MSGNHIVGTVSEEKLEQSDGFYRAYYIAHVPFCSRQQQVCFQGRWNLVTCKRKSNVLFVKMKDIKREYAVSKS